MVLAGHAVRDGVADELVVGVDERGEEAQQLRERARGLAEGDTVRGTAIGVVSLRGVAKPLKAAIRSWPAAGGARVLAKLRVPASSLWHEFGICNYALFGVGTKLWKDFFMGVDLLLHPEATGAN
jgi:hypothetical protein